MKKALLWKIHHKDVVLCELCNHKCLIAPGKRGRCNVRKNVDGVLYSLNYGNVVASNIDPIEKKPLFHFYPGSKAFSVAAVGCNFTCVFCQNCNISQSDNFEVSSLSGKIEPETVVEQAVRTGCRSVAHTYTEPTVYFEFVYDVARLTREAGLKTVLVSNGFMSALAVEMLVPYVDAINIDLKSWSDDTYKELIGGRLQPVLDNIIRFHEAGVLVEVTTLVVPDMNSSVEELENIAEFIVSVDPFIPWHVSRFHPAFKMLKSPPTSIEMVAQARQIGLDKGLKYVYTGNLRGDEGESSFCYNCSALLVKRSGYEVCLNNLKVADSPAEDGSTGVSCHQCGASHNFRL